MISYYSAGTQWSTKKGNPEKVDPENACGKKIAVQKATVQVDDITARSEKCTAAGKDADHDRPVRRPERRHRRGRLRQGRRRAGRLPRHGLRRQQTNGQLELLGDIYDAAPYGYVVAKDQTEFAQAIADAVKSLIDDGTYETGAQEVGRRGRRHRRPDGQPGRRLTGHVPWPPTRRPGRHRPSRSRRCRCGTPAGGSRPPSSRCSSRCSCTCWSRTPCSSGASCSTTCSRPPVLRGRPDDADHDRAGHAARRPARHHRGGHAAVAEPGRCRAPPGPTSGSSGRSRASCCCSSAPTSARSTAPTTSASRSTGS